MYVRAAHCVWITYMMASEYTAKVTGLVQSSGNSSVSGESDGNSDSWLTLRVPILIGVCVGIAVVTTIFYCGMRKSDWNRKRKRNRNRKTSDSISVTDESTRRSRRSLYKHRSRSLPSNIQDCGQPSHKRSRERRERTRTDPRPILEPTTPLSTFPRPARCPRRKGRMHSMPVIPTVPSLQALLTSCSEDAGESETNPYYNQFQPCFVPEGYRVYYNGNSTTTTSNSSGRSRSKDTSGASESSWISMTPLLPAGAEIDDVFSENYFDFDRRVARDGYEIPVNKIKAAPADFIARMRESGRGDDPRESTGYVQAENQGTDIGGVASLERGATNEDSGKWVPPACCSCEMKLDYGSYLVSPKYKQDASDPVTVTGNT